MKSEGKLAIVTRGGQGIGQGIALCPAVFLVSEDTKNITGQSLNVNGGVIMD